MIASGEHSHCKVCGRVSPAGTDTCSKGCRQELERRQRSRRNLVYLVYAAMALVLIVYLSTFLRG